MDDYGNVTEQKELADPGSDSMRAEVAELRAKWDSVPWDAITGCAIAAVEDSPAFREDGKIVDAWLVANAPK